MKQCLKYPIRVKMDKYANNGNTCNKTFNRKYLILLFTVIFKS